MSANNLPIQVTSFVGRERELVELQRLLPTTRLLTLTGAGGTGKTRLALQLAASVLDSFNDGVWFIDLGPLSDPALVPVVIASVLGVREEPGRPLTAALRDWLRPKHLLLILDNCEHLIDACAGFADAVLHASRETCILATGREALGIAGELAWRVPSLQIPNPAEFAGLGIRPAQAGQGHSGSALERGALRLQGYASVRLFVERAKFANPAFALTDANAPAVAQICYRLDGIPLAIELAAARVKAMRVEQIAERLDDRFRLLIGSRMALPRHQTLRSLLDWSHSLLPETERVLFRRLSVFAGGWTLEAAEVVCADDAGAGLAPAMAEQPRPLALRERPPSATPKDLGLPLPQPAVLDLLTHLVDKSLVVLDEQAAEPRYHMLETIRQYAHEKRMEAGEGERLRDQHLAFFQELAERAEAPLQLTHGGEWIPRLGVEHDNLRAALEWACERDLEAARLLAGHLSEFWFSSDRYNEALTWYQRLLGPGERTAETKGMALALLGAGRASGALLFLDDAHSFLEQSVAIWRVLDDKARLAQALFMLGWVKIHQGDSEGACAMFEANETAIREFAGPFFLAWALSWWGRALAIARGDFGAARLLHEQSLAVSQKANLPGAIEHLGYWATQQGDYGTLSK